MWCQLGQLGAVRTARQSYSPLATISGVVDSTAVSRPWQQPYRRRGGSPCLCPTAQFLCGQLLGICRSSLLS